MFPNINPLGALLFIALSFGSTVALVILLLGKYSGAHINPAVTLARVFARLSIRDLFVPYVGFQLLGGLTAGLTLRQLFISVDATKNLGSTELADGIDPFFGIVLEAVGTFVLSFSVLVVSTHIRSSAKQAFLVGTTLFLLVVLIGPLTGGSFNPARSLGPSVASGYFDHHYVFWVGPFLGALLSGSTFRVIRNRS